jgi:peptidoglycan/LPS O-acetylase OafA/YrhL
MSRNSPRMPFVDALKAIASQLIVLHHLAAYGPLSEAAREAAPDLIDWLYDYARIAVQAFLVIGGFLAARGLAPDGQAVFGNPLGLIWKRYLRLAVPFLAAVGIAIVCAALARRWMVDDSIPAAPTLAQWLAHALLLQSLLGYESLSAGVWYIAIDFQLFALMVGSLWLGRAARLGPYAPAVVLAFAVAALFWFNLDAGWDNCALYFMGSYGLGAAVWWATNRGRPAFWLGLIATVAIAALTEDFRLRIAVALAVALTLGFARRSGGLESWPQSRPLDFLGRISYSVFLVHFPVCLVVNALFVEFDFEGPTAGVTGMAVAWGTSIAAGTLFYRFVESAAPNWQLGALLARIGLKSPTRLGS